MRTERPAAVLACALGLACALHGVPPADLSHRLDRRDYVHFRSRHPGVLEPNYLPFMAYRLRLGRGEGDALVLCRWDQDRFPLPVHVETPRIPASLQDEFDPTPAAGFVAAVESALEAWERELEELVRFRRVERARDAALRIRLLAEVAPAPESIISVLGLTPLRGACRVKRAEAGAGRVEVEFEVPEVRLYLADDYGLLNPDQIGRVALHELGHALGMRRHSPVPGDLMFAVARDRIVGRTLSDEDVNSFVSLYRLPNGTILTRLAPETARPPQPPGPPPGPPRTAAAPHVDARFGYELRLPEGWMRIETAQGVIGVDGVSWDYDASFQVIVRGYATIASYLERYGGYHVGGGHVVERLRLRVAHRPALRWVVEGRMGAVVEELTFIETGDGRVVVVIADCPAEAYPAYRPWFQAALDTLEIRRFASRPGRESPTP